MYLFVSFLPIPTTTGCLQDECQRTIKKRIVEETGKTLTVKAGWYTERQMKDVLKMPKLGSYFNSLMLSSFESCGCPSMKVAIVIHVQPQRSEIDAVVKYTSTRSKLRRLLFLMVCQKMASPMQSFLSVHSFISFPISFATIAGNGNTTRMWINTTLKLMSLVSLPRNIPRSRKKKKSPMGADQLSSLPCHWMTLRPWNEDLRPRLLPSHLAVAAWVTHLTPRWSSRTGHNSAINQPLPNL